MNVKVAKSAAGYKAIGQPFGQRYNSMTERTNYRISQQVNYILRIFQVPWTRSCDIA